MDQEGVPSDNHSAVLPFWRDVEIFNIPTAPKLECKRTKHGKLLKQAKLFRDHDPLPWLQEHKSSLVSSDQEEWRHAVFLGVTDTVAWTQTIMNVVSPGQVLTEGDRQNLRGRGWLAALVVNDLGLVAADSFVPASFSYGIKRHREGLSLDGLNDDLRDAGEMFKSRHGSVSTVATSESEGDQETDDASSSLQEPIIPVGWEALREELRRALEPLGSAVDGLQFQYVIKSTLRKRKKDESRQNKDVDVDFMNSFYLGDLDNLIDEIGARRSLGRPLQQYLSEASDSASRWDILTDAAAMGATLNPANMPLGRWPASAKHHLMLAQQVAVGEIVSQLADNSGMVAVNGPPGTGKTTLLCDVIADILVRRAKALASLSAPWEAFEPKTHVAGMTVFPLKSKVVAGTGIVVASNNNTAVENITRELPALVKIAAEEFPDASYFQGVANQIFKAAEIKTPAWGLVAAALGNSENRNKFAHAFFREGKPKDAEPDLACCDIKTYLEAQDEQARVRWGNMKDEFSCLLTQVESWSAQCVEVAGILERVALEREKLQREHDKLQALNSEWEALVRRGETQIAEAADDYSWTQDRFDEAMQEELQAKLAAQSATDRLQATEAQWTPPFWVRWLLILGVTTKRMQQHIETLRQLRLDRADASERWRRALTDKQRCEKTFKESEAALTSVQERCRKAQTSCQGAIQQCERRINDLRLRIQGLERDIDAFKAKGIQVPDEAFFARDSASRHLASVWVNAEFDALRAKLFIKALHLHEATLSACKGKAIANLRAAKAMLTRDTPEPIPDSQRGLLWDILFFTVPVVSSALASFDRLFVGMGREALGWLLIDEAGQATPQAVAGALWRSRRAVVIGDPRQVEPVMTVPGAIVAELRRRRSVGVEWSPAIESAQTLADRTMRFGAYLGHPSTPETRIWTGLPLRAHRRCIDPMFSVANAIAYEDQMVQANLEPETVQCVLGDSAWLDVRGRDHDGQVVAEEMQQLQTILQRFRHEWPLRGNGKPAKVFVISPFRRVAEACRDIIHNVGLQVQKHPVDSGTVHRFQGKEAEVVIIVLGSAPGKVGAGSRTWASRKPNLLNVALTRAKLNVYIIGNVVDWGKCGYFDVLLKTFSQRGRVVQVEDNALVKSSSL